MASHRRQLSQNRDPLFRIYCGSRFVTLFFLFDSRISVSLLTLRYELDSSYSVNHYFPASSWKSINAPVAITLLIPVGIVITKLLINLIRIRSIPKHLLFLQFGRVVFFLGFGLSFILFHLFSVGTLTRDGELIFIPVLAGWVCSIPLMFSRVQGVFALLLCVTHSS